MHCQWRGNAEWKAMGQPMTAASEDACKLFDGIVTQYSGWYDEPSLGGMDATMDKLKNDYPDFLMGHVVRNGLTLIGTTRTVRLDAELKQDMDEMFKLVGSQKGWTEREINHTKALDLFAKGETYKAAQVWEDITVEYPLDILALKFAYDCHFYHGDSWNIRNSVAKILPHWKSTMPLYGYIHGMHSFGLEEMNLYPEAEESARKALSINARDAWATHTLCHVMEMTGRQYEGIHMMSTTRQHWTTCGMLACHNFWHWALYHIELGEYDKALSIFDEHVTVMAANSGAMLDIVDVCSLLYRLEMEGVNVGDRWQAVHGYCKAHLHDHILAFNDIHIIMSCLGAEKKEAVDEMMKSIEEFVKNGSGTNKDVMAEVGEALCKGFVAYKDGDYAAAVDFVNPVKGKVILIGGSHAQRDLVNLFLIQAAIKSPSKFHHKLARSLLNERKLWKPNAPMTDRLIAKAMALHAD